MFPLETMDIIVHIWYMILSLRYTHGLVINPSSQIKKDQDLLSHWVKWFPFYKVCLPFLYLSDSYAFSNGNLASCVLTEIALPTHLEN